MIEEQDLLQQWWEEQYPNAGVPNVYNVSEGVITEKELYEFAQWVANKSKILVTDCEVKFTPYE
jgi:hypothetical protein